MTQIHELQHVAHELLYLGADGSPIYTDSFRQLNTEVLQKSDALFALKGENQLLTYCYGEVFEEELAKEAHAIIDYWDNKTLSIDEQETVDMLKMIEENQYPNNYID